MSTFVPYEVSSENPEEFWQVKDAWRGDGYNVSNMEGDLILSNMKNYDMCEKMVRLHNHSLERALRKAS